MRISSLLCGVSMLLLLTGCSGITPSQPYNHREEGPPGGLFTGLSGAWTIGVGDSQAPPSATSPSPTSPQR